MASTPVATVEQTPHRADRKLIAEWSSIGHLPSIAQASLITKGFGGDGFVDSVASRSFAASGTTLANASKAKIAPLVASFAATLLRAWSQWVLEAIVRRIPRLHGAGSSKVGSFTSVAFLLAAFKALHVTWKRCRHDPFPQAQIEPELHASWAAGSVGGSLRRLRDAVVATPPPPPPSLALTTSQAASVLAQLESLRRVGNYGFGADLVLIAAPSMTEVPCHCCVLAASSAPLREMLLVSSRGGTSACPSAITMPRRVELSVSAGALQLLVAFVYGESMEPPADVAGLDALLAAATTLEVTPLANQCAAALTRAAATPALACDALRLAHDFARSSASSGDSGSAITSVACVLWAEVRALALASIAEHFEEVTAPPVSAALRLMRHYANRRKKDTKSGGVADDTSSDVVVAESGSDDDDYDDESGTMENASTARALPPEFTSSSGSRARTLLGHEANNTSPFLQLPEELLAEVLRRPELNCSETIVLAAVLAWLDHADTNHRAPLEEGNCKQAKDNNELEMEEDCAFSPFGSPSYDARRRRRDIAPSLWHEVPATEALEGSSSDSSRRKREELVAVEAAERSKRVLGWVEFDLVPATFLHVLVESHPRFAADPSLVLSAYRAQALRSDRSMHSTTAVAGILGPGNHSHRSRSQHSRDKQMLPAAARAAMEPPSKPQALTTRLGQWWLKWRAPPRLVVSTPSAPFSLPAAPSAIMPASRATWTPPPPSSSPLASRNEWDTADDEFSDDTARELFNGPFASSEGHLNGT